MQMSAKKTVPPKPQELHVVLSPTSVWHPLPILSVDIHLVGECFILIIHQNTTDYSHFADVSVSVRDLHQKKLLIETKTSTKLK